MGLSFQEIQKDIVSHPDHSIIIHYSKEPVPQSTSDTVIWIFAGDYQRQLKSLTRNSVKWLQQLEKPVQAAAGPDILLHVFGRENPLPGNPLYGAPGGGGLFVTRKDAAFYCNSDFIALSYFFLSLENERQVADRDQYSRFHKRYSVLGESVYHQPTVDRWTTLLKLMIKDLAVKRNIPIRFTPLWPNGRRFALVLTHDVDRLRSWTFSKMRRVFKEKQKQRGLFSAGTTALRLLRQNMLPRSYQGNFKFICRLERKYGGSSTFFFVGKSRTANDPGYQLGKKRIRRGIRAAVDTGSQIGLHGSFPSAVDGNFLQEEKEILSSVASREIRGNRQHYLRFEGIPTLQAIEAAGLRYDSTLGFSDELGYRCGTGLPFRPVHPGEKKIFSYWEIPLILMDTVLLLESKLNLAAQGAWEFVLQHLQEAAESGSCLTVNWHNNNLHTADYSGYTRLYENMLNWALENNGWLCSADQLWEWWEKRDPV
ncbi:MAG: polysaccharide deacetylase family protein [Calditrichia bacterium]